MGRICLYYRKPPERDRWVRGDRLVRPLVRRLIRGRPRPSGLDKVFINLCLGLDRLAMPYEVNLPFRELGEEDRIGVLGVGRHVLEGYDRANPIVAGIGLMTYPGEWPTLCDDYPVVRYLQHSEWVKKVYEPFFGERCALWPVGVDTQAWAPASSANRAFDFILYDKIQWRREQMVPDLLQRIRDELARRKLSFLELRYGAYDERQYRDALRNSRFMLFLTEHESQGLACLECLSSNVPVLAWDQGWCQDPERIRWGQPHIAATSVPFFDRRCGLTFRGPADLPDRLTEFLDLAARGAFAPRDYVTEHLTLEKCSANFLRILEDAGNGAAAR
jgi:glycosyltransferase involved in cell wall biosynthesis